MSYVVKYKDRIVLGIIPWNNQYIMDVMRNRYREMIEIPSIEPEESKFPLSVNSDIIIYPAEEDRPGSINPMIEFYQGPTWEFVNNRVIAHYVVLPLDLNSVKQNYKAKAAFLRYPKEIEGTEITLNGVEYNLDTDRNSRVKFIERLTSMTETSTVNYKFNEGWVSLTKENVQSIVNAIDAHVQTAFDEEYALSLQIDAAKTVEELLAIELLNREFRFGDVNF
jgi:hypothetical protein